MDRSDDKYSQNLYPEFEGGSDEESGGPVSAVSRGDSPND